MRYGRYSQETVDLFQSIRDKGLSETIKGFNQISLIVISDEVKIVYDNGLILTIYSIFVDYDTTKLHFSIYNEESQWLIEEFEINKTDSLVYSEEKFRKDDQRKSEYFKTRKKRLGY